MLRELSLSILTNNGNICTFMSQLLHLRAKAKCFMHIISCDHYKPP